MTLAANLRRIRKDKKLSQEALAKKSGVSQQSISRLESGVDLTSKHLAKLAIALGCSVEDLDESYSGLASAAEQPTIADALKVYSGLPDREKKEFLQFVLGLGDDGQTPSPASIDPEKGGKPPQ